MLLNVLKLPAKTEWIFIKLINKLYEMSLKEYEKFRSWLESWILYLLFYILECIADPLLNDVKLGQILIKGEITRYPVTQILFLKQTLWPFFIYGNVASVIGKITALPVFIY